MAMDASIPLGYQPTAPSLGSDPNALMQLLQTAQAQKKQNALRQILSNPANSDPTTGLPNAQALQQIMKIDPMTGIKLAGEEAGLKQDIQKGRQEEFKLYRPLIDEQKSALANILKPRIDQFGIDKATAMSRSDYAEALKSLKAAGVPDNLLQTIPQELTPSLAQNFVASAISPEKQADLTERSKRDTLESRKETERERHDMAVEERLANSQTQKGWAEYQDRDGNTYRENVNAGLTQKKTDGKWTDIDSLPANVHKPGATEHAQFDPKMGDLMAALAEQGVSLPTGFRSKEQQVSLYKGLLDRNPNLSAEEIATKLKTGQIEFGAQKKETQTAAGVAGKVEVFQNELTEAIPILREASAAVPRGKWVPINKLMQMADTSISDPNLKKLKIYINAGLNAYDGLAARGGTDKDKRAEVRNLLMSADGPEALNAALEAFGKEAEIAHSAAVKATKVPELKDEAASKNKNTSIPDGWSVQVK